MSELQTAGDTNVVDPASGSFDYNAPPNARTGVEPQADGGDEPKDEKTDAKADEKSEADLKASEAGKELAARKGSLLGDLKDEREARKTAEATAAEQQRIIDSWRPIIAKLEGRPDLQDAVMRGEVSIAKAEATMERENKAELEEIASDLGYVKEDGRTLDLDRAQRYKDRHTKWARQTAEPMFRPLQQDTALAKAMDRVEQAVAYATKEGDADPEIVRAELTAAANKNPAWLLDNDSGNLLYDRCVAKTVRAGKSPKPPAKAVAEERADKTFVETEASGGRHSGPNLTPAERQLGEQYGLKDEDWKRAEAHSHVRRGYSRLTDD